VVFLVVMAAGAVAAFGASTFVSSGDDGAATARGAQAPLGTLSATPRSPDQSGNAPDTESSPPGGLGAADTPSDQAPEAAEEVVNTNASSKLPFTGLLAIPVLLAGAGLLLSGYVVRRRTGAEPTSA
jgi:hypothetical protein